MTEVLAATAESTAMAIDNPLSDDDHFVAADEITNLHAKLKTTQDKFSAWNEALEAEIREWFTKFTQSIGTQEGHLSELKNGLQTLKNRNQENQQAASDSMVTLDKAREYLAQLKQQLDIKQSEKDEVQTKIDAENTTLETQREALAESEAAIKQRSTDLNLMSVYAKEILGLSFQKAPGQKMQVVFRNIDVNSPDDPFVLSVAITDRKYQVSDCDPPIEDLAELTDKLNETNNFRSFILSVRERFQKLV